MNCSDQARELEQNVVWPSRPCHLRPVDRVTHLGLVTIEDETVGNDRRTARPHEADGAGWQSSAAGNTGGPIVDMAGSSAFASGGSSVGGVCPRCRDARAGRHYVSRSRYRCTGERVEVVSDPSVPGGARPLYLSCDALYDDPVEAAAEAAEHKARKEEAETRAALARGVDLGMCRCYTAAIRRCARCNIPTCADSGACCFKREGKWFCSSCNNTLVAEQKVEAEREKKRREDAYKSLPAVTVRQLAAHLNGEIDIVDGKALRLDEVTFEDLAAAFERVSHRAETSWRIRGDGSHDKYVILKSDGRLLERWWSTETHYGSNDTTTRWRKFEDMAVLASPTDKYNRRKDPAFSELRDGIPEANDLRKVESTPIAYRPPTPYKQGGGCFDVAAWGCGLIMLAWLIAIIVIFSVMK